MTNHKLNCHKIKFISNCRESDYKTLYKFYRLDEALETIRGYLLLPIVKMPTVVNIDDISDLLCLSNGNVLIDYKIRHTDDKFELLELSLEAYNRFEQSLQNLTT